MHLRGFGTPALPQDPPLHFRHKLRRDDKRNGGAFFCSRFSSSQDACCLLIFISNVVSRVWSSNLILNYFELFSHILNYFHITWFCWLPTMNSVLSCKKELIRNKELTKYKLQQLTLGSHDCDIEKRHSVGNTVLGITIIKRTPGS